MNHSDQPELPLSTSEPESPSSAPIIPASEHSLFSTGLPASESTAPVAGIPAIDSTVPDTDMLEKNAGKNEHHDPYQALRHRNFRLFLVAIFLTALSEQMISVAIGWELYQRTSQPIALGLVGLVQVLPVIVLSLFAGDIADRANRKLIMLITMSVLILCIGLLGVLSFLQGPLLFIYGVLLLIGIAVAFYNPASSALIAQAVPESVYESAATWQSTAWQLASVSGPALGGFLIAAFHQATFVFVINAAGLLIALGCLVALRIERSYVRSHERPTLSSLMEGLHFLRQTQVMLAAITLDLFAVLLGGAVALLPIYARDILQVGPTGLGWLQAAPSVGALIMAFTIAHLPPFKHAGRTLLLAVGVFGLATCVFGLSNIFWLSLVMLILLGAMDNISVVIRSTLMLTRTPEGMRGRVSAVNGLFIAMSNQLGGFESGLAAQFLGPMATVALGGLGTIIVVVLIAIFWPDIRRLRTLREVSVIAD